MWWAERSTHGVMGRKRTCNGECAGDNLVLYACRNISRGVWNYKSEWVASSRFFLEFCSRDNPLSDFFKPFAHFVSSTQHIRSLDVAGSRFAHQSCLQDSRM